MHHGNTIVFRTAYTKASSRFPAVPWAMNVARDYDNLGGQILAPGKDNRSGPGTRSRHQGDQLTHYWEYWQWVEVKPYGIPFRCLYSRNVENLMMAGKHISVSHVAGSSTKTMLNGGQHGVAVGTAAYLCKKHSSSPRGVGKDHMLELQNMISGKDEVLRRASKAQ